MVEKRGRACNAYTEYLLLLQTGDSKTWRFNLKRRCKSARPVISFQFYPGSRCVPSPFPILACNIYFEVILSRGQFIEYFPPIRRTDTSTVSSNLDSIVLAHRRTFPSYSLLSRLFLSLSSPHTCFRSCSFYLCFHLFPFLSVSLSSRIVWQSIIKATARSNKVEQSRALQRLAISIYLCCL